MSNRSKPAFSSAPSQSVLPVPIVPPGANDMRRRIPVTAVLGQKPDCEVFLLVDDDVLERAAQSERTEIDLGVQALRDCGWPEPVLEARRAAQIAASDARVVQYQWERETALPSAQALSYVLVLPLLSDWQRIVNAVYGPYGDAAFRPAAGETYEAFAARTALCAKAFQERLLKNKGVEVVGGIASGIALSPLGIDNLHPVLRETLGAWMVNLLAADPRCKMLAPPTAPENPAVRLTVEVEGFDDASRALGRITERLKTLDSNSSSPSSTSSARVEGETDNAAR